MLGVILVHFNIYFPPVIGVINNIGAIGARCPQLFFIISAYFTWYELDNKNEATGVFYKKKVKRITPLYYISLLVALLLPVITIMQHPAADLIAHLFFVNGFNPYWNNCINVEWYVTDLMLWYLLAPWLYKIVNDLKKAIIAFLISGVISAVFIICANHMIVDVMSDNVVDSYFHTQSVLIQIPVLLIGVILYYIRNDKKALLISILLTAVCSGLFISFHMNKVILSSSLVAGMMFGCLFLIMKIWFRNVSGLISFIGRYSLGVYVCHLIVIRCFAGMMDNDLGTGAWAFVFVIVVTVSVAIGYATETIQRRIMMKNRTV